MIYKCISKRMFRLDFENSNRIFDLYIYGGEQVSGGCSTLTWLNIALHYKTYVERRYRSHGLRYKQALSASS